MTELVMTTEAEVEDFTDELSDEALDRAEGAYSSGVGRLYAEDVIVNIEGSAGTMIVSTKP